VRVSSNFILLSLILIGSTIILTGNTLDEVYSSVKKWGTALLSNKVSGQISEESDTKINKESIYRISWTGDPRVIKSGEADPYDSKFFLHGANGDHDIDVRVNGDGTLSPVRSTPKDGYPNSPRLYVKGPWKDTELTIWAKASSFDYLQLRGRNDHTGSDGSTKCGFGGHIILFRSDGSTAAFKEITHPLYTKKISGGHFTFTKDKWIGYRATFIGPQIEGFVNTDGTWVKIVSKIDDGSWPYSNEAQVEQAKAKCGTDLVKKLTAPFTAEQPYNFVRINNGVDVFFKSYSIKEI
jgi:hypothetical protein